MPQIVDEAGNEARADKGVELRSPETCLVQGSRTNAKFRVPVRWHNSFGPIVWLFDSFFLPINEGVDGCHFEGAPRHVCASRPCAELRGSRARASPELKSDLDDDLFSFVPSHSTTKVPSKFLRAQTRRGGRIWDGAIYNPYRAQGWPLSRRQSGRSLRRYLRRWDGHSTG